MSDCMSLSSAILFMTLCGTGMALLPYPIISVEGRFLALNLFLLKISRMIALFPSPPLAPPTANLGELKQNFEL